MRCVLAISALIALLANVPAANAWWLVQVGPHERSLEIVQEYGACDSLNESVVQGASFVRITITATHAVLPPGSACPAIAYFRRYGVALSRPLAGRHIEGAEPPPVGSVPDLLTKNGKSYHVAPRLIGLSPADARSVLGALHLHAEVRVVRRVAGVARVVSESPAAGTPVPTDRPVRVDVAQ
jgi:hypothetical protein